MKTLNIIDSKGIEIYRINFFGIDPELFYHKHMSLKESSSNYKCLLDYMVVQLREIQFDCWLKVSLFQSFSVNMKILNTQSVYRDHRSV